MTYFLFCILQVKSPFAFLPKPNTYTNYLDAIHFEAGIQNSIFRDFQFLFNIPTVNIKGKVEIDYDLVQKIWWIALQTTEKQSIINFSLQLRIFKGSDATLSPSFGFDYVCSIQFVRSEILDEKSLTAWNNVALQAFNAWRTLTDSQGNRIIVRPHWPKQWESLPKFKSYISQDVQLKKNIRQFLADYKEIAKIKNFSYEKNIFTFSNKLYRDLLNSAIEKVEDKIK